jgi:23S rRNA U2552 (ribose-2'-O)-methylase RlmE/FtsJ
MASGQTLIARTRFMLAQHNWRPTLSCASSFLVVSTAPLKKTSSFVNALDNRRSKHSQSSKKWLQRQHKDLYAKKARDEGLPSRAYYKLEQIDSSGKKGAGRGGTKQNKKRSRGNNNIFAKGQTVVELGAAPGGWSLYASTRIGSEGTLIAMDLLPLDTTVTQKLQPKKTDTSSSESSSSLSSSPKFGFYQGDFRSEAAKHWIIDTLSATLSRARAASMPTDDGGFLISKDPHTHDSKKEIIISQRCVCVVDVVMSDMAANFTGDASTDALRTMALCEEALLFAIGSRRFFGTDDNAPRETREVEAWKQHGVLKGGGVFLCKFFAAGPEAEQDIMKVRLVLRQQQSAAR